MIFSSLHANDNLQKYPPCIRLALTYLQSRDFTKMDPGIYPIQGDGMYALLMDTTTAPITDKRAESHKKYVDIQFIVHGREQQGCAPDSGKYPIVDCNIENDLYFYEQIDNESFLTATEGCYSIFFPNDIHRPGCMVDKPETVRKVVVKVSISTLNKS